MPRSRRKISPRTPAVSPDGAGGTGTAGAVAPSWEGATAPLASVGRLMVVPLCRSARRCCQLEAVTTVCGTVSSGPSLVGSACIATSVSNDCVMSCPNCRATEA